MDRVSVTDNIAVTNDRILTCRFGYSDEKVARLTREAIAQGFNHFKVKVGADVEMDSRRLAIVRSIIDDPKECEGRPKPSPESLVGKNAGPTGSVLMIDANQVWE